MAKEIVLRTRLKGDKKAKDGLKGIDRAVAGLGKSAIKLGGTFFAAQGVIAGFNAIISASGRQELAEKKLETALGKTSNALLSQASALQQVSTFGDEAIIEQQGFLASLKFTEDQIKEIIPVAMDLASATGMSLESAVRNTAKTFSGMAGELGELVPQIRGLTKEQMEAGEAVKIMGDLFGGQALAQTETMAGSLEQMKNSVGDAAEALGSLLAPVVITVSSGIKTLAEGLSGIVNAFSEISLFTEPQVTILSNWGIALNELSGIIDSNSMPSLVNLRSTLEEQLQTLDPLSQEFNELSEILNVVNTEIAERGVPELKRMEEGLHFVKDGIKEVNKQENIGLQLKAQKTKAVIEELKQAALVQGSAEDAMRAVVRAESMEAAAGYIASIFKSVPYPFNLILAAGGGAVAGGIIDTAISKFATGGDYVTSGPEMIMVGDNPSGRERVQITPLGGDPNINGPQGNGITINISAPLVDETVIDHIIPAIKRAERLNLA